MSVTPGTAEKSDVDETASPGSLAGSVHVQFASWELEWLRNLWFASSPGCGCLSRN